MSQYENLEELLAGEKARKPWFDDGTWTDEDIYRLYRKKNPTSKPLWEEHDKQLDRGISGDVSSNALNGLASTFDYFIDNESSNWMKLAYNKSLTGLTEQLFSGDERYDLNNYDPGIVADVASTALSFVMPLDILTFWAGGQLAKPISGFAAKGLGYSAQKVATAKGKDVIIPAYRVMAQETLQKTGQRALLQGINQGTALAVFEGAIGGVQAAINGEEILPGITHGVIHGGIMGVAAGAVGGGLMAKHAHHFGVSARGTQIAKGALEGQVLSPYEHIKKVGYGIPGQLAAESAVFTAPVAYELSKTDELTVKNLLTEYAKNVGLFGILKTKHHLLERGKQFVDDHFDLFGKPSDNHGFDKTIEGLQENLSDVRKDSIINKELNKENIDRLTNLSQEAREKAGIKEADYIDLRENIEWLRKGLRDNSLSEKNSKDVERASKTIIKMKGLLKDLNAEYREKEGSVDISEDVQNQIVKFDQWKKEIEALDTVINNLDNVKTTKEDAPRTPQRIREYLKGKEITEIERDVDPVTGKPLEKPEIVSLAKATREELEAKYFAQKELVGEKIALAEAEAGVPAAKKIAAETTKQMAERLGLADVEVASKVVEDIKSVDIKSLPEGQKDSKKFLNRQKLDPSKGTYIEPQSKETNIILVDWLNSIMSNTSTNAMHITRFLKQIGKKDISDITHDDIKNWINRKVETGEDIKGELTNISNVLKHASDRGFIAKLPATGTQMKKMWHESNERIKARAKEIKLVVGEISKELGGAEKTLEHIKETTRKDLESNTAAQVHGKEGFGLRAEEVYRIKPEHLIKDGDYYAINMPISVAKSYAREVPITKELYNAIQKVIHKKGIKTGSTIFDKGTASKILELSGIGKKLKAGGVFEKLELVSRKLVESIWKVQKLSQSGKDLFKSLMGHEKWSDKIYGIVAEEGQKREINKLARNLLDGKLSGEKFESKVRDILGVEEAGKLKTKEQLQLERQTKLKKVGIEEQKKQREFFIGVAKDKIPDFSIKLNRKLGKKNGDRILGSASEYTARIAKGEVREDTVPHEVSHVFTTILENFGTPEAKRILQEGLRAVRQHHRKELAKLSKSERIKQEKELLNQTVGEMATEAMKIEKRWEKLTGEKAPLYKKLGRVIKKFWSQMKIALGMGNEKDVARIMAEGFVTGKLIPTVKKGAEISKVEYYQTERTANSLRNEIKVHEKILTPLERKEAREFEGFTIPSGKGTWKKGLEDGSLTTHMLDQYLFRVRELAAGRKPVHVKINEIDRDYNVSLNERSMVLDKVFGVKDGNVDNIKNKTLYKEYEKLISRYKNKYQKNDSSTDFMHSFYESNKLPQSIFRRAVTDVFHLIRDHFNPKLAYKMNAHDRTETSYRGIGVNAVHEMSRLIGKDVKRLDLYDKEVVNRKEKADALSKKDKRFIQQLKVKGSNERKALSIHKKLTNFYWKSLFAEYKRHMPHISFSQFKESFGERFITNYFTRRVRNSTLEYLNPDAKYFKKVVDRAMKEVAQNKAKEELKGKKNVTASDVDALTGVYMEDATLRERVIDNIDSMLRNAPSKMENPNLFTRGIMFPEYIPVIKNGKSKMVRTYEPNYGSTLESYIRNMSKFLSTARHFPEFTKIGSKYNVKGATKATLIESKIKGKELGEMSEYAYNAIMNQIGNDIYADKLNTPIRKFFRGSANLFAATGLSSPLSGVKNIIIYAPRNAATLGFRNTIRSIPSLWDRATWTEMRKAGITEYGAHSLELAERKIPGLPISMEAWFKFNLMTKTENWGRIIGAKSGLLAFDQVLRRRRGEQTWFGSKRTSKNDLNMMREVWKLSEKQIDWLEKADIYSQENAIRYKAILDHVMQESHISTAGGTSTTRLPLWFQSPYKKELTLFQRIATSVTIDTYHNYIKPAVKFKNFTPLAKALIGHGLAGASLYALYDTIIGQEPPESQSSGLEKAGMYLWRGEFFGVLGESLSPYERELAMPVMEPIIYRNLKEGGTNLMAVIQGHKTWKQGISDFTRQSVVVVNQIDKLIKKTKSPHYEKHGRIRTLTSQFMDDKGYNTPTSFILTERQPYYKTLSTALMFGNDEVVAKAYWAAMNYLISDQSQHGITNAKYAAKQAHRLIMRSVKGKMNPLNLSDEKIVAGKQVRLYSKREEFLKWLTPEKRRDAIALEKEYFFRLRKFEKLTAKKYYKQRYSVFPYL